MNGVRKGNEGNRRESKKRGIQNWKDIEVAKRKSDWRREQENSEEETKVKEKKMKKMNKHENGNN